MFSAMPIIRPGMKRPPPGFELISDKLDAYDAEMRIAMSGDPLQAHIPAGKPRGVTKGLKSEDAGGGAGCSEKPIPPLWRVARINRERTRYVFNACHREKTISTAVLDYCCKMNFIDSGLVRRWRLPGYEGLCCIDCCVPGRAGAAARMVNKHTNRHKARRRVESGSSEWDGDGAQSTCICRVPAERRHKMKRLDGCTVCGCTGCVSGEKKTRETSAETTDTAPVCSISCNEDKQRTQEEGHAKQ